MGISVKKWMSNICKKLSYNRNKKRKIWINAFTFKAPQEEEDKGSFTSQSEVICNFRHFNAFSLWAVGALI